MKIGVVKTSLQENERRVPIYPEHLLWINENHRKNMLFENNYGEDYDFSNEYFKHNTAGIASRKELFEQSDILLLPKPTEDDLKMMKDHQILWGWPHCVQRRGITQLAIDKKLTLIAWEAMNLWSVSGEKLMHIFYKNNEIAGYAAVLHVLELLGMDGHYGARRQVVVIGYGSVSRGAIYALQGRGFNHIHAYTKRPTHLVADQNPDVYYHHLQQKKDGSLWSENIDGSSRPFIEVLSDADIICNGVLQNTDNPLMFVGKNDVCKLKSRSIIIDISCDKGMGFSFARPTTFDKPIFTVGDDIKYYSVDHTPTYLWNAASREISKVVLQYLPLIASGPDAWIKDETIRKAIEIKDGVIQNPKILTFQGRDSSYPHKVLTK